MDKAEKPRRGRWMCYGRLRLRAGGKRYRGPIPGATSHRRPTFKGPQKEKIIEMDKDSYFTEEKNLCAYIRKDEAKSEPLCP